MTSSTFSGYYTNAYGTLYYEGFVPTSYHAGTPLPLVVALNMMDIAERRGTPVSPSALSQRLGVPVIFQGIPA